jgi:hypothetical protein
MCKELKEFIEEDLLENGQKKQKKIISKKLGVALSPQSTLKG